MILINNKTYEPKFFGDGTLKMLTMDDYNIPEDGNVLLEWRFDNIGEYMIIMYLVNYIRDTKRSRVELELPYVPDARMDRVKHPEKEGHTLKYLCDFLNSLNLRKITVTDPHSPVTMSLLKRAKERNIQSYIEEVLRTVNVDVFLFPDKGARDRYAYLDMRPAEYGEKTRNWETGRIDGFQIINFSLMNCGKEIFANKKVLIIDDICAYGGTFHHATNAAHDAGAEEIYLFVTHCENDILKGDLINNPHLSRIFTTSSIFRGEHEKIWRI